jgi:asparagine synthase (glutamine-hydrolysing)
VERRLEDGAVGACLLSGGLDSSIIAAAVKALGADMPLLTVGYQGGAPDVENAKLVAEHLGMKHEVLAFGKKEIEKLVSRAVNTMESFDEDCVSGTISNLFASELASRTTNCILSGEGGDELFGGYHLLKDVPTESGRLLMMRRLVDVAYNTAVQRLDRSMMGNSINYRTPFIDTEVMAFAAHVPVDWKIHRLGSGELIEKWLLREAFKEMLPDAIYRRSKLRFAGGTGTDDVMDEIARGHVADGEFNQETRSTPGGYTLSSPKELWYYRLFKEQFPAPCFEQLVGRWDPNK